MRSQALHKKCCSSTESLNSWGWKGPLEIVYYNPTIQSRANQSRLARTLPSQVLSISMVGDSTASPCNLFQWFITLSIEKYFLSSKWNFLYFSLCLLPLVPIHPSSLDATKKSLVPLSLLLHMTYLYTLIRSPEPSLFQGKQSLPNQSSLLWWMLQYLNHLCGPLLGLHHHVHISLVLRNPELDTVLRGWPHQHWVEGKDHLPQSPGNTLSNEAQDADSFLCSKGISLADIQFMDPRSSSSFKILDLF